MASGCCGSFANGVSGSCGGSFRRVKNPFRNGQRDQMRAKTKRGEDARRPNTRAVLGRLRTKNREGLQPQMTRLVILNRVLKAAALSARAARGTAPRGAPLPAR